jgi:hypothetical protein
MLAALLLLAVAPAPNVHSARVPSLNEVRLAIAVRGGGTRFWVSDERCSPVSVPRRERRRALAAARCSFRYGAAVAVDPPAGPARWRRQHAFFYLTGAPCEGERQDGGLTCYSWTADRALTGSGAGPL